MRVWLPCAAYLGLPAAVLVAAEKPADAAEPSATAPVVDEPAFRYTRPYSKDYLRTTVEEGVILGAGFLQYTLDKSNEADWDLAPKWSAIESKLTLDALTYDNNNFDTNWLTHPVAGWFYYSAARSNRLSIPASFLFAFGASTAWEVLGEIREHAAINDLIATPVTGLAIGEPMLQLGALTQRSSSPVTRAFGWVLSPFKAAHDAIDGLEVERAAKVDGFGLPTDVWHRITIGGSVGVTRQERGVTQGDLRVFGQSRIVSIPGYGAAGRREGWFDGGEVTDLRVQAAASEGVLVDLNVAGHVLPLGYAYQDVRGDEAGRLDGHGFFGGLHIGAEYGHHDFDRDGRRLRDRIALVAGGATIEERIHIGRLVLRGRMDGLANFGGVESYAKPEETRQNSDIHLTSVLRSKGYYHAIGATFRPRVEAERMPFDAGTELRVDWFDQITGRDVEPIATNEGFHASDRRIQYRAWIGYWPTRHLRISLMGETSERSGRVNASRASRSEIGLHGGAEIVF